MLYFALLVFLVVGVFTIHYIWISHDKDADKLYQIQQDFLKKNPSAKWIKKKKSDAALTSIGIIFPSLIGLWVSISGFSEIGRYGNMLGNDGKDSHGVNTLFLFLGLCLSSVGIGYSLYLLYTAIREPHFHRFIFTDEELLIYKGDEIEIIRWEEINKIIYDSECISIRLNNKSTIDILSVIESIFIKDPFPKILELFEQKEIKMYRAKNNKF